MKPRGVVAPFFDRMRRWGPELGWVASGQVFAFLGALVSIKVLTTALGPAAYGELALGLAIAGALHMFVYSPIDSTVLRFVSVYQERGRLGSFGVQVSALHRTVGGWLLGATCITGLVLMVTIGTQWALLAALGMVFSIVIGAGTSLNCLLTGLRERRIVALYQGLEPWLRLLAALAAVTLIHGAGHVALLGFIGGTLLAVTIEARYALKVRPGLRSDGEGPANNGKREFREQFLRYGTPFMLFAGFAAVTTYADRWLVLAYLDGASVGTYVAMLQIANAPTQLTASVTNQFFVPIIFERATGEANVARRGAVGQLILLTLLLYGGTTVAFTLVAVFYAPELLDLFTTSDFKSHSGILWIMTLGIALANVGHTLTITGMAQGQSRRYIAARVAQTAAFLISALALLGRLGMEGMAWALCVSSVVYIAAVALTDILAAPTEVSR